MRVDEIALTPEVYGEPARVHVSLGVDDGSIDVNARLKLTAADGHDVAVTTEVRAERLPLRRARLYIPKVGWSELRGELDLALTYALEPRQANQLRGTLALREVAVSVPSLEDSAASWKSLTVNLDSIDLLGQRAVVNEVAIDGAHIQLHAGDGKLLLPVLDRSAASEAPADRLRVSGSLALADLRAAPPDAGLSVDFKTLDLRIEHLAVPGVIPLGQTAAAGSTIDLAAALTLTEPHIARAGDPSLTAGGKGAPIAPAPIAFRLGRAEPTTAGAEAADRLAAFLIGRPGMGVQLDTTPTQDDVRWLCEQALGAEWEEQGLFERSIGFLTQRGPRQRIRTYIEARAADGRPELSAEDQATLQQWLDERPTPTAEQLRALAAARVAVVETVLHDKGIDAARIAHGEPSSRPPATRRH